MGFLAGRSGKKRRRAAAESASPSQAEETSDCHQLSGEPMRLVELIPEKRILADMQARTKDAALREMAGLLGADGGERMQQRIWEALVQRERLASTGIGEQVAIPHGKLEDLGEVVGGLARSVDGIDFGAIDGRPTHLFFVIVAPGSANGVHLKALARIARCCKNEGFRGRLMSADQAHEIFEVLDQEDCC